MGTFIKTDGYLK